MIKDAGDDNPDTDKIFNQILGYMFPSFTVMGIVFSSGAFIITLVKDREEKLRYLLNFAGIRPPAYILGLFLADYILYFIPISVLMAVSLALDMEVFNDHAGAIYGILLVFGFPFITFIYVGNFLFSKHETAFKYIFLFLLLVTGLEFLIMIPWDDFFQFIKYTNPIVSAITAIFSILVPPETYVPLSTYLLAMVGQCVVLLTATILIDTFL